MRGLKLLSELEGSGCNFRRLMGKSERVETNLGGKDRYRKKRAKMRKKKQKDKKKAREGVPWCRGGRRKEWGPPISYLLYFEPKTS